MVCFAVAGTLAIGFAALIGLHEVTATGSRGQVGDALTQDVSQPSSWTDIWWESLGARDPFVSLALGIGFLLVALLMRKIVIAGLRDRP
jgi:ABC-type uncharacterized transport system YnjBCD permease subunit